MSKDNIVELKRQEADSENPITSILRQGARKLLAEALEAEVKGFLSQYKEFKDEQGRQRITRNGYLRHWFSLMARFAKSIAYKKTIKFG